VLRVGIVGFRGYSGAELVRLLDRHPQVEPVLLEHREDADVPLPPAGSKRYECVPAMPEAVTAESLGLVFLATPAEVSMDLAPAFLRAGARVVDLAELFDFAMRTPIHAGTKKSTPRRSWFEKPFMACQSSAGTEFGARGWLRTRAVIPRRRIWQSSP